jgi:hypothetical protein
MLFDLLCELIIRFVLSVYSVFLFNTAVNAGQRGTNIRE